jgi:type VI secretion system protein ImpK
LAINAIVRPFLSTIVELAQLTPERRPVAEVAHKEVRALLDETMGEVADSGLSPEDQQDVRFALVAFADEQMQLAPGRFQDFWSSHLLQETYFGKALAGEEFYVRLGQLRSDERRHGVLLVYYLCMLFGYRGKQSGLAFENLLDDVRRDLQQSLGLSDAVELAPLGDRPDELAVDSRRNLLLQSLAIAVAVLSLMFYVGLWLVVDDEAVDVRDALRQEQRQLSN